MAPGTLGCPKPGPLKCFCAPRHQILARCAAQKRNCDKAKCATKLRQLSAPKYAYLANYAYLGAPNMVSLKRSFKMQFGRVDLRSIGPPSQKLWPNLTFARLHHCNYNGGVGGPASSKARRQIWEKRISDFSFYWPKDQESSLGNMIFQKCVFVKRSIAHRNVCMSIYQGSI